MKCLNLNNKNILGVKNDFEIVLFLCVCLEKYIQLYDIKYMTNDAVKPSADAPEVSGQTKIPFDRKLVLESTMPF